MQHYSGGAAAAAAGHRDPTTLFDESASSATSSSSSSDEDGRVLRELVAAAPGLQAAPVGGPPLAVHRIGGAAGVRASMSSSPPAANRRPGADVVDGDAHAHAVWRRRQRERLERRFFRNRGALEYAGSAIFTQPCSGPEQRGSTSSPPRNDKDSDDDVGEREAPHDDCVPHELQAWYVSSNTLVGAAAAPSASSSSRRQRCTSVASPIADEVFAVTGTARSGSAANASHHARSADDAAGTAFGAVDVHPAIRSSGAGTTSVNVFQSCAVASLHEAQLATPAAYTGAEGSSSSSSSSAGGGGNARVDEKMPAAVVVGGVHETHATVSARGGRPPLRAHRYVEQPNGLFLSHAEHADLLGRYAVEQEIRSAQEREDARRARRWARLLYGRGGGRDGGGVTDGWRQDGTIAAAGVASVHTRHHWMYDAATYRRRCLSTQRYLQRVHVALGAVAAGVSLLALLALVVPVPGPNSAGANAPSPALALLLLVARPSADGAAALVLPVWEPGIPATALAAALLQPYHAALMLCLSLLLVITGYAPVPWGVAERFWLTQRRRWAWQEEDEEEDGAARPAGRRRSRSLASSDDPTPINAGGVDGVWAPRSPSSAARRATAAVAAPPSVGGYDDDGSRSTLFAASGLPHSAEEPLGASLGGGGGWAGTLLHTHGRHRQDALLGYSVSLGASIGPSAFGATLGSSIAAPPRRQRGTSHLGLDVGLSTVGEARLLDGALPPPSPSATLLSPHGRGGGSPTASTATDPAGRGRHAPRGTAGAAASPFTGTGGSGGGGSSSGGGGGGGGRGGPALAARMVQLPPPLLLLPVSTLEGGLAAGNIATRTFDYVQRRAMQWLCHSARAAARVIGVLLARRRGVAAEDAQGGGRASVRLAEERRATAARRALAAGLRTEAHLADPVVPPSLYLHVLLQPRLWCVVVALVLTVVEVAVVDERSVELMWLAQPASWWQTRAGAAVPLPHAWTPIDFTATSTSSGGGGGGGADGGAVRVAALTDSSVAVPGGGGVDDVSGSVWRVLTSVYAARTAVLWVAFVLNLFC